MPADSAPARGNGRMSRAELRSSFWVAAVYGVRMLGMFLILPVFSVHAATMPGGSNTMAVGLALGIYGLTQACLQIPFGAASDRFGRKPVILIGLLVMLIGSIVAALSSTLFGVTIGRALQGAGAVSAALAALVADLTRDEQRTKAMAMIGGTIGVAFAVSLVAAPALYSAIGMSGIFALTGLASALAMAVVAWCVPTPADLGATAVAGSRRAMAEPDLIRLDVGVFTLHLAQMAMFVVVPARLVNEAGLPLVDHWKLYLPVVGLSFIAMMPLLIRAEHTGRVRSVFLFAIMLLAAVQAGFALLPHELGYCAALLFAFFFAFNMLEALLPSLTSRLAPANSRGLALGLYNTAQALGVFAGGLLGGALSRLSDGRLVFAAVAVLLLLWWVVARGASRWPSRATSRGAPDASDADSLGAPCTVPATASCAAEPCSGTSINPIPASTTKQAGAAQSCRPDGMQADGG